MPVLSPSERVVKCPTNRCPGWITVDTGRPQTVPCRYCRVTVHTLAYLLGQGDLGASSGAATPVDLQDPALHATFNDLMLALAGTTGGNVYLRPTERALVAITDGPRGVVIEYQAGLAGRVGPAALVGLLMHRLLHVELHPRTERVWRVETKPGGRQDLGWLGGAITMLADHVWLEPLLDVRASGVRAAMQTWGLDVALMLSGGESFFPTFLGERNLRDMAAASATPDVTPEGFAAFLLARLGELSAAYFGIERNEPNRFLLALQIADLRLRNPEAAATFAADLEAREALNLREALPLADRMGRELAESRADAPAPSRPDSTAFRRTLDGALKGLNISSAFDIRAVKAE